MAKYFNIPKLFLEVSEISPKFLYSKIHPSFTFETSRIFYNFLEFPNSFGLQILFN
jgi:hypothetical protein